MPINSTHAFGSGGVYARAGNPLEFRLGALTGALVGRFELWFCIQRAWQVFERCSILGPDCLLGPNAWCVNFGQRDDIQLGARVICRGLLRRESFGRGRIVIQDDVYIGDDCLISCADRVEIGAFTMLAHGVQVFDNDTHPLDYEQRVRDHQLIVGQSSGAKSEIPHAVVLIGRNVWIGFNAIVMKGVKIGDSSVVAASSVVIRDVPPYTLVGGNPARVIRTLASTKTPLEMTDDYRR